MPIQAGPSDDHCVGASCAVAVEAAVSAATVVSGGGIGRAQRKIGEKEGSVFKDDVAFKYADNEDVLKKLAGLK